MLRSNTRRGDYYILLCEAAVKNAWIIKQGYAVQLYRNSKISNVKEMYQEKDRNGEIIRLWHNLTFKNFRPIPNLSYISKCIEHCASKQIVNNCRKQHSKETENKRSHAWWH